MRQSEPLVQDHTSDPSIDPKSLCPPIAKKRPLKATYCSPLKRSMGVVEFATFVHVPEGFCAVQTPVLSNKIYPEPVWKKPYAAATEVGKPLTLLHRCPSFEKESPPEQPIAHRPSVVESILGDTGGGSSKVTWCQLSPMLPPQQGEQTSSSAQYQQLRLFASRFALKRRLEPFTEACSLRFPSKA